MSVAPQESRSKPNYKFLAPSPTAPMSLNFARRMASRSRSSVPATEIRVLEHFQKRMPYGKRLDLADKLADVASAISGVRPSLCGWRERFERTSIRRPRRRPSMCP
jgi:hypothetical protein